MDFLEGKGGANLFNNNCHFVQKKNEHQRDVSINLYLSLYAEISSSVENTDGYDAETKQ